MLIQFESSRCLGQFGVIWFVGCLCLLLCAGGVVGQECDGFTFNQSTYGVGDAPNAVVGSDLNQDGFLDLVVVNSFGNSVSVMLNLGDGAFGAGVEYTVGDGPQLVAAGDLDIDGISDLVVSNRGANSLSVLRGLGGGVFSAADDVPVGLDPEGVLIVDVDKDGLQDIVVAISGTDELSILMNTGSMEFATGVLYPVGDGPLNVETGDFDQDGAADLVVTCNLGNTACVLMNQGNGSFVMKQSLNTGASPKGVDVADLNGDGWDDFVVSVSGEIDFGVSMFLNDGGGDFEDYIELCPGTRANHVVVEDFDQDQRPDVLIEYNTRTGLYKNAGNGDFEEPLVFSSATTFRFSPSGIAVGDFDANGIPDVVKAILDDDEISVSLASEGSYFQSVGAVPLGTSTESVAVGDLNGDGLDDLVYIDDLYALGVMLNDNGSGFHPVGQVIQGASPTSMRVSDINADGFDDVLMANQGNASVSVYLSDGGGHLSLQQSFSTGSDPVGVNTGDADMDGDIDIVVACDIDQRVEVYLNDGAGEFSLSDVVQMSASPIGVHIVKLGDDGASDILVRTSDSSSVFMIEKLNHGGYGLPFSVVTAPGAHLAMKLEDVNGDDRVDIALLHSSGEEFTLFRGIGNGKFASVDPSISLESDFAFGFALVNMEGDSTLDLVISSLSLRGVREYSFDPSNGFRLGRIIEYDDVALSLEKGHFDHDGRSDLISQQLFSSDLLLLTTSCGAGCLADLVGDGVLNFFDVSAFLVAYQSQDPIADFTGDGMFNFFDVSAFLSAYNAGCP